MELTKTRSPQTAGVAALGPGRGVTQTTFSVLLQFSGRPVSGLEPFIDGPRHWGQSSARAVIARDASTAEATPASESAAFSGFRGLMLVPFGAGSGTSPRGHLAPHSPTPQGASRRPVCFGSVQRFAAACRRLVSALPGPAVL